MLDEPLLIVGETGTGKDMLAKACHLRSARGHAPFLGLNCASLPDDVVESELFGYAVGAYPNALEGKKGFLNKLMAELFCWMKLQKCRHRCKLNYFVFSMMVPSVEWVKSMK